MRPWSVSLTELMVTATTTHSNNAINTGTIDSTIVNVSTIFHFVSLTLLL